MRFPHEPELGRRIIPARPNWSTSSDELRGARVSVSLPSSRNDSFSVDIAKRTSRLGKSGLTFAPGSWTYLRDVINKGVMEEDLLVPVKNALKNGLTTVKLYFMRFADRTDGIVGFGVADRPTRSPYSIISTAK